MLSSMDIAGDRWLRILARWSLLSGITYLGLLLVFFVGVFPAISSSALPEEYNELVLAANSIVVSRLSIILALTYWMMIGGFFLSSWQSAKSSAHFCAVSSLPSAGLGS